MSENEKENQHTINQSLIKNIKIVPENIKRVEKQAWNGKCIEKTEQPVNFNTHFKSEKRTIKIYSINIDDFEENGNENEKLCAKEIVKSCEITIISENSWPNFGSNERENVENQTKQCEKKKKSQKPYIIRIYECCPWNVPWILMIISFIQIGVFTWNSCNVYDTLIFSPVKKFEIWRFFTYSFLHAGTIHLALNILIQLMLSTILETEQGNWRVLCVYMGGILGGSLAASIFEESPMIGASSGVYSLLLSHIPHIIMNFSMISHRYFRIVCVMVLCLSDISYSIRHCILQGNLQPKIGIAAHVAGAISGILLGFIFYKNLHSSKVMIHRATKWISMILVTCWIAVTIFYNIKYNKEHL